MCSPTVRFVFWTIPVCLAAAAASSGSSAYTPAPSRNRPGQERSARKTTDPPVAARGKLGQDLFLAIDHRDLSGVQTLIKEGADPNARNGLEFTPLYIAAASHQDDVMQALLGAGAQPDATSAYGTALMFAAATANLSGADLLLTRGVNVNVARGDGNTPLMMAANAGFPPFVGELLKNKADVNAKNANDSTALTFAARQGHLEVGRMLLEAGATVDNKDVEGQTPLMAAAMTGHPDFVNMLLEKGAKPTARDAKKRTALILAASYGDYPEVIQALLKGGADAKATDGKGRTAAAIAVARGYTESAAALGKPAPLVATSRRSPHQAILLSLKVLQSATAEFERNTACISCHQEGLVRIATGAARDRGFRLDGALLRSQTQRIGGALAAMQPLHQQALKNPEAMKQVPLIEINEVNTMDGWVLAGMAAQHDPSNDATAAMAMVLARQQAPDGHWSFSLPRIPMQSSFFTFTALAIRSLGAYGPKSHGAEIAERIQRAKKWLLNPPAKTSEDCASRILGLKWAGTKKGEMRKAIAGVLAFQHPDGGWSQMPDLHSDAYATGQALYALHEAAGLPVTDPVYRRGVQFLLRTQDDDGSWFVNKRAFPANNYFDAGFPHGESQYASFNGTCWATLALLETISSK
ncbi:MAG: ankyrin repeat domain-containing protein [Fimbriimonadales bacterium]